MPRLHPAVLLLAALIALPVPAAEPLKRQVQAIPVYAVSPGAAGSVDSSVRGQGYRLPIVPGLSVPNDPRQHSSAWGSTTRQQQGGIRQSIEYPNGLRVEQLPEHSSYQQERDR